MVDGVLIRPLERGDRHALVFVFGRLGERSRRRRFHGAKRSLGPADLALLTDVDHWHREAVIAFSPLPRAPIGVARYVRTGEFDVAELAIAVADGWQGRGVGTALMAALGDRARRAGVHRYVATVHADNAPALALIRRLGPVGARRSAYGAVELTGSWAGSPSPRAERNLAAAGGIWPAWDVRRTQG